LVAYFYLPRRPGDASARTEKVEPGLLVDYAGDNRPIGIEITAPSQVNLEAINRIFSAARQTPATTDDLASLAVAG